MATTPQVIDNPQEESAEQPQAAGESAPSKPDYGEWNEQLPQELQACIKKLAEHICDEFKYPRRLEVMQSFKSRSYWRELQHLNWNWDNQAWDVLGPAGLDQSGRGGDDRDSAVMYTTNIYQRFGKIFLAVITQAVPNLRFEPEDAEDASDIATAEACEDFKKYIQHENDPIKLMTKAAYIAWTDGRMHGWTRWEVDKRTGKPRETQSIVGVMEVKVPIIYEDQYEYNYLQYSTEKHVSTSRATVKSRNFTDPDYWKKIKGGSSGNGQDTYERTARIAVKQGISWKSAGGDAYSHLCTEQRTWIRPTEFLNDCVEDRYRDTLESLFPSGCYVEFYSGVYAGSREANMDDEWAVENIMEGDGSARNSQGTCILSVQERTNDTINTTQDTFEKCQPARHLDDKMFDIEAIREQQSAPGQVHGVNTGEMQVGDTIGNHVYEETPAKVDQSQLLYLKEIMSDAPESLTGLSSILFGSAEGDKSGKALQIQQAAAMGIVGLPFRVLKRLYARMMEQAVRCAAANRKDDVNISIPDQYGERQPLSVRVGDLDGKIRCFAEVDENIPESPTQKRATYMLLLQDGNTDPIMRSILANPKNQNFAKKIIGLQELEIPDADSWKKQMGEISFMLQEPPAPPEPQPPQQVPNPLTPDVTETIQPPPTPPQSSLPIDPDYDNHAAELLTVTIWINSSKGQQVKIKNPEGFENVRLHGLLHKQALQAMMPQQPPPVPPGGLKGAAPHAAPAAPKPGASSPAAGAPPQ